MPVFWIWIYFSSVLLTFFGIFLDVVIFHYYFIASLLTVFWKPVNIWWICEIWWLNFVDHPVQLHSCTAVINKFVMRFPPNTSERAPALTSASQAGTRFTYPGGMEGWVDLGSLIAARPGIEPTTVWSLEHLLQQHLGSGTVCRLTCPIVSLGGHLRHFFLGSRVTARCDLH